jgi:hypothetical protein
MRAPADDATRRIKEARVRVGRRVYFRTSEIAEVLSDESLSRERS